MNRNIFMLTRLYDATAQGLQDALSGENIMFNDERIKERVRWLGDIAKTLSLVYQIETMRTKDKEVNLPKEEIVKDPAVEKAKKNQFNIGDPNQDLSQFGNGWQP